MAAPHLIAPLHCINLAFLLLLALAPPPSRLRDGEPHRQATSGPHGHICSISCPLLRKLKHPPPPPPCLSPFKAFQFPKPSLDLRKEEACDQKRHTASHGQGHPKGCCSQILLFHPLPFCPQDFSLSHLFSFLVLPFLFPL